MPNKPKRPCGKPGCRELTEGRYCELHRKQLQMQEQKRRGTAHERGYDGKWRTERAKFLREHPLCRECEAAGFLVAATVVDHITPHKGDKQLFWRRSNWQPLCETHHNRKTALEDGGFGR